MFFGLNILYTNVVAVALLSQIIIYVNLRLLKAWLSVCGGWMG